MNHVSRVAVLAAAVVALSFPAVATVAQAEENAAIAQACAADKSPKIAEIKQRGVLRWALGIAAPFGAKDAQNNYVGADPGSARELADILGVKLELKDYSYNLLPPTVAAGVADIAGTLYVTEERRKALDFTIPWQQDGQLFATLGSRKEFSSLADLNKPGVRIVIRIGSGQVELAKKLLPNAQIITAEVPPGGEAQYLQANQADATIIDAVSSPLLQKAAGSTPIKMIGAAGIVTHYPAGDHDLFEAFDNGFGIAKGDPGFLACLNAWVADGVASGRFNTRFVAAIEELIR